jgi:hypothetical protein
MRRMTASLRIRARGFAAGVILAMGITGCGNSKINGGPADASNGPDASAAQIAAMNAFDNGALSLLNGNCGACHSTDNEIGFLFPETDVYTRITGWPEILDFQTPSNSLLLTKGQHVGPPWAPDDFEVVKNWIELEAVARGNDNTDDLPVTALFTPTMGLNNINLPGLPGSRIEFLMEPLDTGAYLSEIRLYAGTGGVHVVHPLFLLFVDGVLQPDPVDRFSFVDLSLEDGQNEYIGGGTFVIVNFPAGSDMMIQFERLESLVGPGMDGGVLLDCLEVDSFTTNAQPALSFCAQECHGGNDTQATAATDMRQLLNPAGQTAACGQILARINLQDPANSGLFLAPNPDSGTSHPYKFGDPNLPNPMTFQEFVDMMLLWANTEAATQGQ